MTPDKMKAVYDSCPKRATVYKLAAQMQCEPMEIVETLIAAGVSKTRFNRLKGELRERKKKSPAKPPETKKDWLESLMPVWTRIQELTQQRDALGKQQQISEELNNIRATLLETLKWTEEE